VRRAASKLWERHALAALSCSGDKRWAAARYRPIHWPRSSSPLLLAWIEASSASRSCLSRRALEQVECQRLGSAPRSIAPIPALSERRASDSVGTRHAACHASVCARLDASRCTFDFTSLRARGALGTSECAARARFTDDAAVVIQAGEGALAAGGAGAAAVRAFADAARVVALAADVTRRRHAQERAGAAGAAATLAVGAGAAARGTVAVDVARRSGAAEAAAAVVAAGAVAVGAGAGAVVVVALAHDGARRCGAVEVTRVSRVAHAAPAVAVVVVVAAGSERRGKTEQKGKERDADTRSGEHAARALHGRASRQSQELRASNWLFAAATRARAACSRSSAARRSRPSWRRRRSPP
jgi:hypothetical protein